MSYDPTRTRLENYLTSRPSSRTKCDCGAPVEMHMAHSVYLKCPKCNQPKSKVLTIPQAREIQGMEVPTLKSILTKEM